MVGPSASGSLKGTPTSTISATSAAERSGAPAAAGGGAAGGGAGAGSPGVREGIGAWRPADRGAVRAGARPVSDKVIARREPEAAGGGDPDDRSLVGAPPGLSGEGHLL